MEDQGATIHRLLRWGDGGAADDFLMSSSSYDRYDASPGGSDIHMLSGRSHHSDDEPWRQWQQSLQLSSQTSNEIAMLTAKARATALAEACARSPSIVSVGLRSQTEVERRQAARRSTNTTNARAREWAERADHLHDLRASTPSKVDSWHSANGSLSHSRIAAATEQLRRRSLLELHEAERIRCELAQRPVVQPRRAIAGRWSPTLR